MSKQNNKNTNRLNVKWTPVMLASDFFWTKLSYWAKIFIPLEGKKNDLNKDSVYGLKIYASLGQNKEVCVNARCILKVKIKIQFDKSEKLIFSSKDKMLKMSGWFHKYRRLRESTDGMNTADEWEEIMRTDLLHYMFLEEKWGRKF